jgi:hypothetical protein
MKIDFENFRLFKGIDKKNVEVLNVKNVFADELYTRGQGIAFHALALKIFNSDENTDYNENEYQLMTMFAEHCMSPNFIDSLKALKDENSI